MPAAQQLIDDPVKFMKNNIVLTGWNGRNPSNLPHKSITQATVPMWLHRMWPELAVGRKKSSRGSLPVHQLLPTSGMLDKHTVDGTTITVYYCPYRQGGTLGTVVSSDADLFFTTTMDGCSLGVGSETPNKARLVYHSNHSPNNREGWEQEQERLQREMLPNLFKMPSSIIPSVLEHQFHPSQYRISSRGTMYSSTTFGVRSGTDGWKFYTQRYASEQRGNVMHYTLKEVRHLF